VDKILIFAVSNPLLRNRNFCDFQDGSSRHLGFSKIQDFDSLSTDIHAPKIGFWGTRSPKWGMATTGPAKGTSLSRNVPYDV